MGVPLFFRRVIQQHFPQAIRSDRPRCTTLALDFAGILHKIYAEMNAQYERGWTIEQYVYRLFEKIIQLKSDVNVQKRLIISTDGIAPLGKMNQQRKRRFRHEQEKLTEEPNNAPFDSNAFSPGTAESVRIDQLLLEMINRRRSELPREIIYSGYIVPGEGEHKIITHINELFNEENNKKILFEKLEERHPKVLRRLDRNASLDSILFRLRDQIPDFEYFADLVNDNESVIIHGLDADLIFLTLPISGKVYLWRENESTNEGKVQRFLQQGLPLRIAKRRATTTRNEYLDIGVLREQLKIYNIGVSEFILAGFIFGNDFVPYQAGFNMVSEIADIFIANLKNQKFASPFNWKAFKLYLTSMIPVQEAMLPKLLGRSNIHLPRFHDQNFSEPIKYPTKILSSAVSPEQLGSSEDQSFQKFREAWNRRMTFAKRVDLTEKRSTVKLKSTLEIIFQRCSGVSATTKIIKMSTGNGFIIHFGLHFFRTSLRLIILILRRLMLSRENHSKLIFWLNSY